ncbi:MAG: tetratricopeptide repeat protein [Verrucomicrobia bacterium]|nr:tetratricopeptide repeat protein [Verrucomicrobiota bacterium]
MSDEHLSAPLSESRRLAAVMFTDVAGYSVRMQRDEVGTLALVRRDFEFLRTVATLHGGEVLKSMGDGLLLCFPSVVQAVNCALQVQRQLAGRGADALQHRIGIHLGDVFREGGDIVGDGVNIAARLQTKAKPGTVCVSQSVFDAVKGKVPMSVVPLGPQELKHIAEPVVAFQLSPQDYPEPRPARPRRHRAILVAGAVVLAALLVWWWRTPRFRSAPSPGPVAAPVPVPDKSIAVLPFTNMSDDKDSGYFADGVHEDLLTHLAELGQLKVISRTSVMQYRDTKKPIPQIGRELGVAYILEGSVRRVGNRVRVTGQLIRAATDEHVWAQPYDGDLTDIFALQAQLATKIAAELRAVISQRERDLIDTRPTASPDAYALYLQARAVRLDHDLDAATGEQIQVLLEQALKLDPSFARAWAELAHLHIMSRYYSLGDEAMQRREARAALQRVEQLAPDSPEFHQAAGDFALFCERDYDGATRHYLRLVDLVPNSGAAHQALGLVVRRQGRWLEAVEYFRRAHALDPRNREITEALGTTYFTGSRCAEFRDLARLLGEQFPERLIYRYYERLAQGRLEHTTEPVERWLKSLSPIVRSSPEVVTQEIDWAWNQGDAVRVVGLVRANTAEWPAAWSASFELGIALTVLGRSDEARPLLAEVERQISEALRNKPGQSDWRASLAYCLAVMGREREAIAMADQAMRDVPEQVDHVNGVERRRIRALVLAWTGHKDEAMAEVARLVRLPFGIDPWDLKSALDWTPLHGNPRFEALVRDPATYLPKF